MRLVQPLTGGRTQLTLEHEGGAGDLRLSILTGQFDTDLASDARVTTGQPVGRARPRRDGQTRLLFQLIMNGGEVDPEPWINSDLRQL